jgi:hypothetical protein
VNAVSTPRIETVQALSALFERRGIEVALGGSALLAALGLVEVVRDWDLTTDSRAEPVEAVLTEFGMTFLRAPRDAAFATEACFVVDAGDHTIDVLSRFALHTPDGVMVVATSTQRTWRGMSLGEPEEWARAYRVMGRPDRAAALEAWLRDNA